MTTRAQVIVWLVLTALGAAFGLSRLKAQVRIDGTVTARNLDVGQLVTTDAKSDGKDELFRLAQTDRLRGQMASMRAEAEKHADPAATPPGEYTG